MQLKIVLHTSASIDDELESKILYVNRIEDTYTSLLKASLEQFKITEQLEDYRLRAYNV
jgi:hypothetical protein